ncbi:hypothetical protein HYG86_07350 [Alkalicella caledoniensis]|uniref:Uncharacterized protein n=1 Tax=Alkalicella caledoniensis TaxID=2731377 RepID=A0A7G9W7E8_ALKCA|nr:hypothetical protein [Alkalicella caledoniensis]QNO14610.1 hypothetical protein HYG86_07350 [Alkalicella caledoniensis]
MLRFLFPIILIALSSLIASHLKPHVKENKLSYYIYYLFILVIIVSIIYVIGHELGFFNIIPLAKIPLSL